LKRVKFIAALWCAKFVNILLRLLGRKGTYMPGKLAIKVCPDYIAQIRKPPRVVAITGTNGKTTVNNMLSDALEALGSKVLSNRFGSNINAGIAAALTDGVDIFGHLKCDIAVLECDERSSALIYPGLKPQIILVTNLFRDSMRRNADAEYIADFISKNVTENTKLILNADDLLSSSLAPDNPRVYYGIDRLPFEGEPKENIVVDTRICPICAGSLAWDFRRYNHIGRARCPSCGFAAPEPHYRIRSADIDNMTALVEDEGEERLIKLPGDAVYNIYNTLAVYAALRELGVEGSQAAAVLESIKIVGSRFSRQSIGGRELTVIMAKGLNAVACTRSFDYVASQTGKRLVVLMLDDVFDEKESSENIAWYYDADFEFLAQEDIFQIAAVGPRRLDIRLRLLIAGVPEERILTAAGLKEISEAIDVAGSEKIFVLYELYRESSAAELAGLIADKMRSVSV